MFIATIKCAKYILILALLEISIFDWYLKLGIKIEIKDIRKDFEKKPFLKCFAFLATIFDLNCWYDQNLLILLTYDLIIT